jgi:hypothetical protein
MRCRGSHVFLKISTEVAVGLQALRIGRTLLPRNIPGTHFC